MWLASPKVIAVWEMGAIRKEVGELLLRGNQNRYIGKVSEPYITL